MSFHPRRARLQLEGLEDRTAPAVLGVAPTSAHTASASLHTADLSAGAATQLAITTAPPSSITAGQPFDLTVAVEDGSGNLVSSAAGSVMLSLASNPANAVLGGGPSASIINGLATFTNLTLNTAGAYTLQAASDTLSSATTGSFTVAPADPAQLAITAAPPTSVTAGGAFGLTVQVQDAFGNVDSTYTGPVALTLASNPGNDALQGAVSINAVAGVAAFTGLSLNNAASGYIVQAAADGITMTTGSIAVTAGAPAQLAITAAPPSGVTAGSPFGLTVAVEDASGNVISTYSGPVSLTLAGNPGNAALQGAVSVNASAGVADFTGLSLDATGSYTVQAAAAALTPATTGSVTVAPAGPAQLTITAAPPTSVTAGDAFGLTVQVQDAFGNVDSTYTGPVSLTLPSNPANAALQGPVSVNATSGVATFSGLSLNTAGVGYVLQANLGNLTVQTAALTVTAGPATQLAVTAVPSGVTAGLPFGLTVAVEDGNGNLASSATGSVTLSLASNPGNAVLGGNPGANIVNGMATFTNLTLGVPGAGFTLQAASNGLSGTTTTPFNVTADTPTQVVVTTPPPASVAAGSPFGLTVSVEDASGNVVAGYTGPVALALASNPGNDALQGALSVNATAGVAAFSGLSLSKAAAGYTIQAAAAGLTTTSTITVTPTAPAQLAITAAPPASVTAGSPFGLTVAVEDASGNVISTYSGPVNLTLTGAPGNAALQGAVSIHAVAGVASFTGLSLNKAAGYTIQAAAVGLTNTSTITITPTAPTQLAITTAPPASITANSPFGLTVAVKDVYGNLVSSYTGPVTLSLASNPGNTTLHGAISVNALAGVATFTGLSLAAPAAGYVLQANLGNASVKTSRLTVVQGPATQLVITKSPPASVPAGSPFGLTVAAEDASGNVVTAYNGLVTLSLLANPGNGTLQGPFSVTAQHGVATFSGLSLNKAAVGYFLKATSGSLTLATAGITVTAGAAAQLAITTQPPASVMAGRPFGLTVVAEDALGNVVTGYNGPVTVSLGSNPGKATLQGAATVTAHGGVATFTGLALTAPAAGYTLRANLGSVAAPPGQGQPPAPHQFTYDFAIFVFNHATLVQSYNYSLTAPDDHQASQLLTAHLSALAQALNTQGVAWSQMTPNLISKTAVVSNPSGVAATTASFSVVPIARLAITVQPPVLVTAGSPFGLTVKALDPFGKTATTFSGMVTISLRSNPGGAVLGGTLSVKAVGGVAVFTGLTLNKLGNGYTLQVSSIGLTSTTGTAFSVVPKLVVTEQYTRVIAGSSFSVTVTAEDANGHTTTGYNGPVTLALANNPGKDALHGVVTVMAHNGVATFTGLSLDKAASNYILLVASGSGATPTTSSSITVMPAAATHLVITTAPPASVAAGNAFGLTIKAEDAFGNVATGYNGSVSLMVSSNPGHTGLNGNVTATATAGVVVFRGLSLDRVGSGYTLRATASNLAAATTGGINVTPGAATQLLISPRTPFSVTAGNSFGLSVTVADAFLNTVSSYTGPVTLSLAGNPANTTLKGALTHAAQGGVASFTNLSISTTAAVVNLNVAGAGLSTKAALNIVLPPLQTAGNQVNINV